MDNESKEVQALKLVQEMLEGFKDVMPTKLPKKLPSMREVGHTIELELGAKPQHLPLP